MRKFNWRMQIMALFVLVLGGSLLFQLLYTVPYIRQQHMGMQAQGNMITERLLWTNILLFSLALAASLISTRWITGEQKRMEERLEFLSSVTHQISDAVFLTDTDFEITYANEAAEQLYGYSQEEFIGMTPPITEESREEIRQTLVSGGIWFGTHAGRKKDGSAFYCETKISPLVDAEGRTHFIVVQRDVTERVQAREVLEASEEWFRALTEQSLVGVYACTEERFTYVNAALAEIFGYRPEEIVGHIGPLDLTHPDDRPLIAEHIRRRLAGEIEATGHTFRGLRRDGSIITCESFGRRAELGEETMIIGTLVDITERVQLEEQFRQAQKMEAIGRLTGGIAHDFNNLLTAINGFAQLLQMEMDGSDRRQEYVMKIWEAGQRAAQLIRQLLAFSRKQIVEPRVLDLNQVIEEMDAMLRRIIGEDIEIDMVLSPDLWPVKVDPTQMQQVIMNLAVNARDAMPQGGKLTIETGNVVLDDAYVARHVGAEVGEHVILAISDTGVGMSEEVQAHIFEPFFTTKGEEGTGLGLATVYGIVKQSGGNIWCYSEEGIGTTFKIYLPRCEAGTEMADEEPRQEEVPQGQGVILLVEDEEIVRGLSLLALQRAGYTVLEASGPREALEIVRDYPHRIDLLITDVVMPEMSGRELAGKIEEMCPSLKVLYMSGYTDNAIVHHGILKPGTAFIQKPFTPSALANKVCQVLAEL